MSAPKDVTLQIRMTPDMKTALEALADREGLTVSTYVRRLLARKIYLDAKAGT